MNLSIRQKYWIVALSAIVFVGAIAFSLGGRSFLEPKPEYEEVYRLVPDKLSVSAAVPVRLPSGTTLTPIQAEKSVTFEPALSGKWVSGGAPDRLLFQPNEKLPLGSQFTVALALPEGKLEKVFSVDEDPKIVAVFPMAGAEAPENSEISIVFNRPMVPLTTLDALSTEKIPVSISPATPGRFKWTSTRILQFIPEKRLQRSSHYTVRILNGFTSLDGIQVPPADFAFDTRGLRYEGDAGHHLGFTLHTEPVLIRFNQPIDLLKTQRLVTVTSASTGGEVPFIAEYGVRQVYDPKTEKSQSFTDKSVLAIYNAKDQNGREKYWDPSTNYYVSIAGGVPLEGDISLSETRGVTAEVPEYIANISATSPASRLSSLDMFDPAGNLVVDFYSEIDKGRSSIRALQLSGIEYGEKCKLDDLGNTIYSGTECEKIPDQKQLVLSFKGSQFARGASVPIEFAKIVSKEGFVLNYQPIVKTATIYPVLKITRTVPEERNQTGSVREMVLCSTTPLHPPKDEDFYTKIRANSQIGKWNWSAPYRVSSNDGYSKCSPGEFQNTIYYSLIPQTSYRLEMDLADDFGQTISQGVNFVTEKLDASYTGFFHLQKEYNVTTPGKTKLTYALENIDYVNMSVCKVDPLVMLGYLNYETRLKNTVPPQSLPCQDEYFKRIELPTKFWTKNYFQIDLKDIVPGMPPGQYVVSFGNPNLLDQVYDYKLGRMVTGAPIYERTLLTVTNLAVQEKKLNIYGGYYGDRLDEAKSTSLLSKTGGNLYWVSRIGTLEPVAGARVDLYTANTESGRRVLVRVPGGKTDAQGIARTPAEADLAAAIITSGNDSAIITDSYDKFEYAYGDAPAQRTYLYTDRPIYRPGQEVFVKGISRIGYDADYEVWRERPAVLELFDSKGASLRKETTEVSDYGTFSSRFQLDKNAPLGTYRIETAGGTAYFAVEEYVPAAFKIDMQSDKEEYVAGDTLALNLSADYYFGVPVEKGEAEYSIVSQDYYFDRYTDAYFRFGGDWYYSSYGGYGDRYISRGRAKLDENGKVSIKQKLDFDKLFKDETSRNQSKIFTLRVTVKNSTGQAVSQEKSIIVHRGDVYLGVNLDKHYFGKGETAKVLVKTVDTKGVPVSLRGITGEIQRVTWTSFKRQEVDGRYYYKSEEKTDPVASFSLKTDSSGNASYSFTPDKEGEYRVVLKANDSRGNPLKSSVDAYVYGAGAVTVRPTNNETLELVVEKDRLSVGENAKFIIKSPYPRAKALVTLERGKIFDYSIVDIDRNLYDYSFPILESFIPNVYATVLLLSPGPEIKYGRTEFKINTKDKEISVTIKSDKNNYLPGEEVRLSLETRDKNGTLVPAEVSLAVADLSVLALAGNPKKNPVSFFYSGLPLAVTTASNIKNILYEAEIPTGTKGGGGLEASDLARKKRGIFKDTAYWRGVVRTGPAGIATVSFTLPDNLTTWQAEAVGVTEDTKLGVGYKEFLTKKQISVVPLRPRFILPGDEFMIGAKMINDTDNTQRLTLSISGKSLGFGGEKTQTVSIGAHKTEVAYFKATAPTTIETGQHSFTLSLKNTAYEDTVEQSLPIGTTAFYESVATASFTSNDMAREYLFLPDSVIPDKGSLTVRAQATLVPYLSDALTYLVGYPYGCSEQIASKLDALAIIKKRIKLEGGDSKALATTVTFDGQTYTMDDLVRIGLARIYGSQIGNGGFSYYPEMYRPSYGLSVHVLRTLLDIRSAGYEVDQTVIDGAAQYIYQQMVSVQDRPDSAGIVLGVDALSRIGGVWAGEPYRSYLEGQIVALAGNSRYTNDEASSLVLAHMAVVMSRGYALSYAGKVLGILENRVHVGARGSFIPADPERARYDYYENSITSTALYLKALTAFRKDSPVVDGVLRWLINNRSKDGGWGSTNSTLVVVDAFSDYAVWKQEYDASFALNLAVDGKQEKTFDFNKKTITQGLNVSIPVKDLPKNRLVTIEFTKDQKGSKKNNFYYDALLTYALPVPNLPPRDEGISIKRELYAKDDEKHEKPIVSAKVGDIVRGRITLTVPKDLNLVAVEDYIPAGMELVNTKLATEDQNLRATYSDSQSFGSRGFFSSLALGIFGMGSLEDLSDEEYSLRDEHMRLYPDAEEVHDDRLFLFSERLSPGVYEFEYFARVLIPGTYNYLPAVASQLYAPEIFGRTGGGTFTIEN